VSSPQETVAKPREGQEEVPMQTRTVANLGRNAQPGRQQCLAAACGALLDDPGQAFDRFRVLAPEREELVAIVECTREAIVVAPFAERSAAPGGAR
jgi:hypothetical protein